MYYPQSSSGIPTELGRLPVNFRRRKERDKVSEVWKTFYISPVEPNAVVCRLCSVTLSYVGGSTSGMRNHLQNKHRHVIPKAFSSTSSPGNSESSRKSGEQSNSALLSPRFLGESHPIPSISPPPQSSQVNLSSSCFPATSTQNNSSSSPTCLSPPSPYTGSGENNSTLISSRLAREVAVMCATDLLSPSLVNGKGIHRIFRLLSGGSQPSDLSNLTEQSVRSAMKDLQFSLRLKIQRQLSSCARIPSGEYKKDGAPKRRPVSLILCPWTYIDASASNEWCYLDGNPPEIQSTQYVDVRAQFLGDDWQPESRLLGTLPLPATYAAASRQEFDSAVEKLTAAFRHLILTTYELTDMQIVACVFPKCPVLDACMAPFGWPCVPCVSHILDHVAENAFGSSSAAATGDLSAGVGSSHVKNRMGCVQDLIRIGIDLWKSEKMPKFGKHSDPCLEVENHSSPGMDGLLDNIHRLGEQELNKSVFNLKKGTWRVWCQLIERLSELTDSEIQDLRFPEWKRNVISILPTVMRLGTAWAAFSSSSGSGINVSDDIPLLSCALPILCSLPFCPSSEDSGNGDDDSHKPSMEKASAAVDESGRSTRREDDSTDELAETDSVGSVLRQKLKASLDAAVNLVKSEELKGSALLMALAAFVDPRHKALLFLSSAQREEVQQEVLRLMSAEECQVNVESKSSRESSSKSGEGRKRTSSLGSVSSSFQKRSKLEDLLHGVFGYSTAPDFTDISHEIEHYIGEPIAPLSQIPGAWWRQRESKYPRLSQLARRLLTIPASVSTGRGGMSTFHLSMEDITLVLFLHSNLTQSDLEEMGFEVEGEEEGWRKHPRGGEEEEGERDEGMDMKEDSTRTEDYDESGRVIDDDHFYVMEPENHVIKVEPVVMND
ncbi:uncharacterized protein LOC124156081 isoform X2 [Ischnura elegans]|uniref:uncharacterized protein LOC124156081 isoform X2 n=1 Tax=Ischnura elegans TaxID=197161 RepID=UPI001ED87DB9|nr:uncharacterized protein LOC124156081 isoform X2 [Ischnura elegans]